MGSAEVLMNVGSLQDELERAKTNLKGLNENIRRIIGREPNDAQLRGDRKRTFGTTGGGPLGHHQHQLGDDRRRAGAGGAIDFPSAFDRHQNRRRYPDASPPPPKRRAQHHQTNSSEVAVGHTKSVFSRLSGPPSNRAAAHHHNHQHHHNNSHHHHQQQYVVTKVEPDDANSADSAAEEGAIDDDDDDDDDMADVDTPPVAPIVTVKPRLHSRVIRELPTRQEIVAAQGTDAAARARNRRMFGSLLGTLQKFCQEESRLKPKEDRKAQIEQKLEAQQQQERETMRRERQDLFANRKRQQLEIKQLETKMARMRELTAWEAAKRPLLNFVRTRAKPRVYYLPKVMDKRTGERLAESRAELEKTIAKKRADVTEELATIESRFKLSPDGAKNADNDTGANNGSANAAAIVCKHDRRSPHDEDDEDGDEQEQDDDAGVDGGNGEAEGSHDESQQEDDMKTGILQVKRERDDGERKVERPQTAADNHRAAADAVTAVVQATKAEKK